MRMTCIVLALAITVAAPAVAADVPVFQDKKAQESYAIGAQTARTLRKDGIVLDVEMLIRGFRDGVSDGKLLLSEKELRSVMTHVQQDVHRNMVFNRRALGERNKEEGVRYLAENGHRDGVVTTTTGLQYRILKTGTGARPMLNNTVSVNFRGTLIDGSEFDASIEGKPSQLVVAQMIPGFKEALQLMAIGSKWQIVMPANLAYGERGTGTDVGPHQVLLFEVELLAIK